MTPPPPPPPPRKTPGPPQPPQARAPAPKEQAEAKFGAALDQPAEGRQTCAGDEPLGSEVPREAGDLETTSLTPELELELARYKAEEAGDQIGYYKLREQIGEGGFGTVWVAEQERPVRRRVALKIIKLGMDTKEVIARFEQERQALAMMDHPNIAKVLDAGATEYGRPFFVMELVRGMKMTDFCDEKHLSTDERLELFITVCQAVQHAHQKGIIHRDLKPSNILVTINDGKAVPKVIDFGVAKATQGRLSEHTVYTQFQQMVGTPIYMSPEQAEMTSLDIDTRSDIFSLGVLLYELLTGHTPIEQDTLARVGLDEIRRIIREVDPPRPSLRLKTLDGAEMTTTAKRRATEPAKLPGALRGDLDWIVMKCLEKDRSRRYETANGLALDLQRHLKNEVVVARPPTAGYLLGRLIRRNKPAVAAGCTVVLALIVGFAVAVWQARRANLEANRSVVALDELRASAPAFVEQARSLAAREQFAEAIDKLDYALKLRPDEAQFLVAKGDLLQCQFKLAEAAAVYREALRVQPGLARAKASAKLCDELLAAPLNDQGKLTRESLAKLHVALQNQQRPAAELMPVARLLGEEKKLVVEYWLARLKDLAVSAERPLKDRLTVREDGRLALDLSDTKIADLSPLAGAPLAALDLSASMNRSELTDLSALRGLDLIELKISGTNVNVLTPLREMHTLEKLEMANSRVIDLSALSDLRLKSLNFRDCGVNDLAPIRKMPLQELNLRGTRVADVSPLIGMPIKSLDLSLTPVLDFSPLAQLPLEKCYLERSRITDLSVLRGRPLKELVLLSSEQARNYAVLGEIKTLELLLLSGGYRYLPADDYEAIGALRSHPKLRQLAAAVYNARESYGIDPALKHEEGYAATGSKDIFWQDWDRDQAYLPALRRSGLKFNLHRHLSGADHLQIAKQPLHDLAILKGAPVGTLTLADCPFTDLTPLAGLKLETLELTTDLVADLSPLRGMPLKTLSLSGSKFRDLSPLEGLPLRTLYLDHCPKVTDIAVLARIPTLENITVPPNARNIEVLRKLTNLKRLSFQSTGENVDLMLPGTAVEEFWKDYDANPWIAQLREAGIKPKTLKRLEDGTWRVDLDHSGITDLTSLQGAPISALAVGRNAIADLSPLRGMRLTALSLNETKVTDLSPLQGMPLVSLNVGGSPVADLEPLRGLPLQWLLLYDTQVSDLSQVQGMPLKDLNLARTKVKDLSPLRGMHLQKITLHGCAELTDLSPLAEVEELAQLMLPPNAKNIEFLRNRPKLERLSFTEKDFQPSQTAAEFWQEYDGQVWLQRLRDAGVAIKSGKLLPDGTWDLDLSDAQNFSDLTLLKGAPISRLHLRSTAVTDLAPLRGMALKVLNLDQTKVTDLGPLQGMPLERLLLYKTNIPDLSPLRGMPLKFLHAGNAAISNLEPLRGMPLQLLHLFSNTLTDLGPLQGMALQNLWLGSYAGDLTVLRGMPLKYLKLHDCPATTDFSPLAELPKLTELTIPEGVAKIEFLRTLPNLERISAKEDWKNGGRPDKTAAEYWQEYDAKAWLKALRDSGVPIKGYKKLPTGTWELDLSEARNFSDLTLLKGAPISKLILYGTAVTDLRPLAGMALTHLDIRSTPVTDLTPLRSAPLSTTLKNLSIWRIKATDFSPIAACTNLVTFDAADTALDSLEFLRGRRLRTLKLTRTKVADLSVLAGMPLEGVTLKECPVTDLGPLLQCQTLKWIVLPRGAGAIEPLRNLPALIDLSYSEATDRANPASMTAKEFWKEYDAKKK